MFDPRQDEQLCAAVRSRDMSVTGRMTDELHTEHPGFSLSLAMVTAIHENNYEALKFLLCNGQLDEDVARAAAASEDIRAVQTVLDHGWDINRPLYRGQVPSMLSFAVRNHIYFNWMLARGADVNAVSILNETAPSFAIREGGMKVVKQLLSLDNMDTSRGDLLHCSVQREESADTVELIDTLILEKKVQVGAYQFDNDNAYQLRYGFPLGTALHPACRMGNLSAVQALLRHGADKHQLKKQCDQFVPPTPTDLASDQPGIQALLTGKCRTEIGSE